MMTEYKQSHIYFLQAMMNLGMMTSRECRLAIEKSCQCNDVTFNGNIGEFLQVVNGKIHPFHFKILRSKREDNGEEVYVFVSSAKSDLNLLVAGGDFTRLELDYFQKLLDLIVHSDDPANPGIISSIDALNLVDQMKMSKHDATQLIARLVESRWIYNSNGMISLTPRCILELEEYFTEVHEGLVKTCDMCNSTVFQGISCPGCFRRLHYHCAANYFKQLKKSGPKCSLCGNLWPEEVMHKVQELFSDNQPSITENSASSASRKRRFQT